MCSILDGYNIQLPTHSVSHGKSQIIWIKELPYVRGGGSNHVSEKDYHAKRLPKDV